MLLTIIMTSAVLIGSFADKFSVKQTLLLFPAALLYSIAGGFYKYHNKIDDYIEGLLGIFIVAWFIYLVRKLIVSPKNVLKLMKGVSFYLPFIIISSSYLIGFIIKEYGFGIYCKHDVEIDYVTNAKNYTYYLEALDKVFKYSDIDFVDKNIRIYRIPSFSSETLLEIVISKNDTIVKSYSLGDKSTWEDRLVINTDSLGRNSGGSFTDSKKCIPTVTAEIQIISDSLYLKKIKNMIQRIDFMSLKSVERQLLNSDVCGYMTTMDGIKYVGVIRNGDGASNYFEISEATYDDNRYNEIIKTLNELAANKR